MTSSLIFSFFHVFEKLKKLVGFSVDTYYIIGPKIRRHYGGFGNWPHGSFVSRQLATVRPPRNPFCLFLFFRSHVFHTGFSILVGGVVRYNFMYLPQGVTTRCRLSWLTNSALVFEPKCGGGGGGSCWVSTNEYSCAHGAQINFGDLTP